MTSTVNARGQITIPAALRAKYGFLPGTRVMWVERDRELIPRPVLSWEELSGYLRSDVRESSLTEDLLRERAADRAREDS